MKHRLLDSLGGVTEQLKSCHASGFYGEKELDGWLGQLQQLRQMLDKPVNIEIVEDDAMRASICMIKVIEKINTEINPTSNEMAAQPRAPPVTLSIG
ncbi:unnamed protein product, partial [Rotaria sp. Silwood2]